MAGRTYQPTLRILLHNLNRFTARYQALIESGLTPTQAGYFAALLTAVENMITSLGTGTGH